MKKKPILVLVVLLLLVFIQGQARAAGFWSGNDLVVMMREYQKIMADDPTANAPAARNFIGYVVGVFESLDGIPIVGIGQLWKETEGVTIGQICSIVSKYLSNHPEKWNNTASGLVVDALSEAFPLKRKPGK
jgi:Rap1a immunity proteins